MIARGGQVLLVTQPRSRHEELVRLLDAMAHLIGCVEGFGGYLPDGRCPDVVRLDRRRNVLFVGDAKDTETPGNTATQCRLLAYVRWTKAFVESRGGIGVLAVCIDDKTESDRWLRLLNTLGHEVGIVFRGYGIEELPDACVIWVEACPVLACRAGGSCRSERETYMVGTLSPRLASVRDHLVKAAKRKELVHYREVAEMLDIADERLDHSADLAHALDEVSTFEHERGRPLLSAIVVHQDDFRPGAGFFKMAKRNCVQAADEDDDAFHVAELQRVWNCWQRRGEG